MSKNKTNWDLSPLFKSDTDPRLNKNRAEVEAAVNKFVTKWQKRNDYLKNPRVLRQTLDDYEKLFFKYGYDGDEGYYFELRSQLEEGNPKIKARYNQVEEFRIKNANQLQFFELNLAKVDPKLQSQFINHPSLLPYKHFLEKLFVLSPHLLSDAEEKIINMKHLSSHTNWVKMTSSFLADEEDEVLGEDGQKKKRSFAEIMILLNSQKKRVRDDANRGFNKIIQKHLKVATEEINSILANKKVNDELKKYSRPDESRLLHDDVDTKMIDTLLGAVVDRFDLSARFYKLKARLFKVPRLGYHERNIEYGQIEVEYQFNEAVDLVSQVFERLDPKFNQIFQTFLEKGQVDVYPRKGKRSNAACWHNLPSQPSYVLLNYGGKLKDVITIAHEFGHAINNELMREKQNALSFSTPTSTAEVASIFMEDFVIEEILKKANKQQRLAILLSRLNEQTSTVFRQVGCYLFEKELHDEFRKKGYLSSDEIGAIFQMNMRAYMGPAVEQPDWARNWWVYWNHIRLFFYVYSYAGGQLIGMALQNQVRKNPKNIEGVKQFLAAGTSKSPKQIFAELGIDITKKAFWDAGLEEFQNTLEEAEKLAKKLGKI